MRRVIVADGLADRRADLNVDGGVCRGMYLIRGPTCFLQAYRFVGIIDLTDAGDVSVEDNLAIRVGIKQRSYLALPVSPRNNASSILFALVGTKMDF